MHLLKKKTDRKEMCCFLNDDAKDENPSTNAAACIIKSNINYLAEQEKVRQRGSGAESRSRTVYAKLESNSEPERARVWQRVAVRANESQSGSHREPLKARERQGEIQEEPCGPNFGRLV